MLTNPEPPVPTTNPLVRLVSVAEDPSDDDDARLRRRVAVVAGYLTILAPLSLPLQAGINPLSLAMAVGLSLFSLANLITFARTRRFERYIVALISAGVIFVPLATFLGGGITGSSSGLVWGFLIPAYAIMALGPRRASRWFVAYLGIVAVMVIVDPFVRERVGPPEYVPQLFGYVVNAVMPVSFVFFLLRYTDIRRRAAEAQVDALFTNAIPSAIATRLRHGERRIADAYPATTIVFADIVGFTPWAQRTPPEQVVEALDSLFTSFDELASRHGLEKIKTIGDAYMAVAGAPEPRADHAMAAIEFARSLIAAVSNFRQQTGVALEVRVGVASGPVVGGVIGDRRIQFDLWGDTVNLASRLESSGIAGRVQVSAGTHDLLGDRFEFEEREIDVKGLGMLTAYLLKS